MVDQLVGKAIPQGGPLRVVNGIIYKAAMYTGSNPIYNW